MKKKTQIVCEKDIVGYVLEQFQEVKESNKVRNLILFQTRNKYMLMAHNQNELKRMGNIVANANKNKIIETLIEYEIHLRNALVSEPTIKKHSNVILHIFGYFSNNFNSFEKKQFLDWLEQFRKKEITIGEFLSKISPIVYKFNNTYLANQTYFLLYSDTNIQDLFQILPNSE